MFMYLPKIRINGTIEERVEILIIINFGMNPNKGGRPPKDIKIRGIINFQVFLLKMVEDVSFRENVFILENINIKIKRWIV